MSLLMAMGMNIHSPIPLTRARQWVMRDRAAMEILGCILQSYLETSPTSDLRYGVDKALCSYMVKVINVEPGIVFCRAVKD